MKNSLGRQMGVRSKARESVFQDVSDTGVWYRALSLKIIPSRSVTFDWKGAQHTFQSFDLRCSLKLEVPDAQAWWRNQRAKRAKRGLRGSFRSTDDIDGTLIFDHGGPHAMTGGLKLERIQRDLLIFNTTIKDLVLIGRNGSVPVRHASATLQCPRAWQQLSKRWADLQYGDHTYWQATLDQDVVLKLGHRSSNVPRTRTASSVLMQIGSEHCRWAWPVWEGRESRAGALRIKIF